MVPCPDVEMAVVMVLYDFEQRMPLYMCIRFNKDSNLNEVFIVISITA